MSQPETRYWLKPEQGPALLVPARGLLFGRAPECDVVLSDAKASKYHAIVRVSPEGLELIALGRNPTRVNAHTIERFAQLSGGDRLALPGGSWQVVAAQSAAPGLIWHLSAGEGASFGLRRFPFSAGGGPNDDLHIDVWPPQALRLVMVQGTLVAELSADLEISGVREPAGAVELPEHGDRFQRDGVTLTLLSGPRDEETTLPVEEARLPTQVTFTFMPTGGRLELRFAVGPPATLELPELRGRLVAALLQPPGGVAPGDWVSDEALIPAVWSANSGRNRVDLNLLIHHTRKALLSAGLDPGLLARARSGGGTSFRLALGASVEVR